MKAPLVWTKLASTGAMATVKLVSGDLNAEGQADLVRAGRMG